MHTSICKLNCGDGFFLFSFLVILFVCHSQRMDHAASFFDCLQALKDRERKNKFLTTTLKLLFVITHFWDVCFKCNRADLLCYDFFLSLCSSLLTFLTCVCVCVADGVPWRH